MQLVIDIPDPLYAKLIEANYREDQSEEEIEHNLKMTIMINGLNGAKGQAQHYFKSKLHAKIADADFEACSVENQKLQDVGTILDGSIKYSGQTELEETIEIQKLEKEAALEALKVVEPK